MISICRLITALTMPTRATRISTPAWLRLPPSLRQHSSLHSSSVWTGSSSTTHSNDASHNPPILLLEGDQFCVSDKGVARTLYQLERAGATPSSRKSHLLAIEELYNLSDATKEFIVRQDGRLSEPCVSQDQREVILGQHAQGLVRVGPCLTSIKLQEIDEGENLFKGRAGTGATTWEASIAMGLYFANHPEKLRGHVVEVGCGMGLGGILNHKVMEANVDDWEAFRGARNRSMTLTDGNEDVVIQCKENVRQNIRIDRNFLGVPISTGTRLTTPIRVSKLDWNDFVSFDEKTHQKRYDTVIACDCAYLHTHVSVLGKTLQGLLKNENGKQHPRPTIHLFGPYNRSALHEVIRYLGDELNMQVMLESVEMSRFRLKPFRHSHRKSRQTVGLDECAFASEASAKFLHVEVTTQKPGSESEKSLFNID